ncbi:MAG: keto-hydroxyglutarate-aldolase/keto-deoxy-phosphogluconate aldolase, partial [Oscillospiraceae bacterium]|nr:keto-hydroxyglutarate-aldolase/keto-deoxy-phosphogluconate aldolase [Oscillospiraceae bacterium]
SEIDIASRLGLTVVKFFPAETNGGLANIKALSAPFPNMKFIPTGGITLNNLNSYLGFGKILACGGSFMVSNDLIIGDNYDGVVKTSKEAIDRMLGFSFAHIGINEQNENDADNLAKFFCDAFSLEYIMKVPSIFAGLPIEVMKNGGRGKNGHIAFYANNVERAIYHLEARGYTFDSSTARIDDNGNRTFIYFEGEYGGFAVHIVER